MGGPSKLTKLNTALSTGRIPETMRQDAETRAITHTILLDAGIDPAFLAKRLREGLSAEMVVVHEETQMDGKTPILDARGKPVNIKRERKFIDHAMRLKYLETVLTLLTPKEMQGAANQAGGQADEYLLVPKELLGLGGQELTDAFMARSRAIANGLPPPELPKVGEVIENEPTG